MSAPSILILGAAGHIDGLLHESEAKVAMERPRNGCPVNSGAAQSLSLQEEGAYPVPTSTNVEPIWSKWTGPSDPEDPRNFAWKQKWLTTWTVCCVRLLTLLAHALAADASRFPTVHSCRLLLWSQLAFR